MAAPPPPLTRASSADFLDDPRGLYTTGANHLVWCRDPSLCGAIYWGRPMVSRGLLELLGIDQHRRMRRPIDVLTDTRRVDGLDDAAFQRLVSYVRRRLPELTRSLRRHAIVHAGGDGVTVHAIVGLYAKMEPRFSVKVFERVPDALRWLGRTPSLAAQLDQIAEGAAAVPTDLLGRLRELLTRERRLIVREEAAVLLGEPISTLRKELDDAETSCSAEWDKLRIEWAKGVLQTTDERMEVVAEKSGFGSRAQLFRTFRKATGVAPHEYRHEERQGQPGTEKSLGRNENTSDATRKRASTARSRAKGGRSRSAR